jgi:hypothetical protein
MFHRLRHADPADPAFVDRQTIETALKQQDILPYWVPKLMEISTAPLTRVDARRAFAIGVVDRDALVKSFWDRGYSDDDSETLANYVTKDLINKWRNSSAVTRAAKMEMTFSDLDTELNRTGLLGPEIQEVLDFARVKARMISKSKCTKAARSRFLTGEKTALESIQALNQLGHDPQMVSDTVAGWQCESAARGKPQSASTLCRWLGAGLITAVEMLDRLGKLGFSPADAMKITIECQQKVVGRATKEYERQVKAQQREIEKQARIAQRDANKLAGQIERGVRAQKAAAAAKYARDLQLVKSSRSYSDEWSIDITDTYVMLTTGMQATRQRWALSPDQGMKAMVLAIETSPPVPPADILARIDEIGESIAIAEGSP